MQLTTFLHLVMLMMTTSTLQIWSLGPKPKNTWHPWVYSERLKVDTAVNELKEKLSKTQVLSVRIALYNGLKLGEQTRGRPASRLEAKEAIDRTLKNVRRLLAHFNSYAWACT